MENNFDLQKHIEKGVEKIVTDAMKAVFKNPRESAFMAKFAAASRAASKVRLKAEEKGDHTPAFLIASVTSSCNLHCAGCYSRCIHTTTDEAPKDQLTGEEWKKIFLEAESLGISFILLAGGEPLLRRDIIDAAADVKTILFPVFTNGTLLDADYLELFDRNRNLVPVLSIEGNEQTTDARRGEGVYGILSDRMKALSQKQLLFGASITVTTENMQEVMEEAFLKQLAEQGCRMILYIEFVPVTEEDRHLAPKDPERKYMEERMLLLRQQYPDLLLLSFPGDELAMGGCMAAGREFFHINANGGAEPCPFSPFSDINVKRSSLKQALHSDLFRKIRSEGLLLDDHAGGCVLYEKREQVQSLLSKD